MRTALQTRVRIDRMIKRDLTIKTLVTLLTNVYHRGIIINRRGEHDAISSGFPELPSENG